MRGGRSGRDGPGFLARAAGDEVPEPRASLVWWGCVGATAAVASWRGDDWGCRLGFPPSRRASGGKLRPGSGGGQRQGVGSLTATVGQALCSRYFSPSGDEARVGEDLAGRREGSRGAAYSGLSSLKKNPLFVSPLSPGDGDPSTGEGAIGDGAPSGPPKA